MSHGPTSDICENVLYCNSLGFDEEKYEEIEEQISEQGFAFINKDWQLHNCDCNHGRKQRLYCEYVAMKDEYSVHLINTSRYNNVGEYKFTASGERKDIEQFQIDFDGIIPAYSKIEDEDVVTRWS